MADARSALLAHLTAPDATTKDTLASALEGSDLAEARRLAAEDPSSAEAVATVLGLLLLQGAGEAELLDAAKAAAQRAPRDDAGNAVALLAGALIWRHSGQAQLAEPYFRRVRRSDPANAQVLAAYREMFAGEAAASQLLQVLVQARRASGDPEQRLALADEMATLAETRLHSPDRAIEVWRSVIREDGYTPTAGAALSASIATAASGPRSSTS
jgi:Tfp pilus assembly protein PilF